MALPVKLRLMLVNIERINIKDKKTGADLAKIKYTFKTPAGDILERYLEAENIKIGVEPFRERLAELNEKMEFEESKSHIFNFLLKTYTDKNGETISRYLLQK